LGITDRSAAALERFDDAYLGYYPYLLRHVPVERFRGLKVLEVGLGYGTLGQRIAEAGADYLGLDIAAEPVRNMNERLRMSGLPGRAIQGNVLRCPAGDDSFDAVVSIGCFHHTGDVQRCIDETHRVLKPGGSAYIMVYNRFSYRQWYRWPKETLMGFVGERLFGLTGTANETQRAAYDAHVSGEAAPETAFTSRRTLRAMLRRFNKIELHKENCDSLAHQGRELISRASLLPYLGPLIGLDIYVKATK
jgi:SAM-dependent methyltransferase